MISRRNIFEETVFPLPSALCFANQVTLRTRRSCSTVEIISTNSWWQPMTVERSGLLMMLKWRSRWNPPASPAGRVWNFQIQLCLPFAFAELLLSSTHCVCIYTYKFVCPNIWFSSGTNPSVPSKGISQLQSHWKTILIVENPFLDYCELLCTWEGSQTVFNVHCFWRCLSWGYLAFQRCYMPMGSP